MEQRLAINKDSLNYQIYRWWLQNTDNGRSWKWKMDHKGRNENLCHYVRVILFWAPLAWMFTPHKHVYPWTLLIPVLVLLGAVYAPDVTVGVFSVVVITIILTVVLMSVAAGVTGIIFGLRRLRRRSRAGVRVVQPSLVISYVKAKKQKICPLIILPDEIS